ncbi:AAA family ATPase [Colwellia demingiae]|nr:AAA family ATPase [Colwellia demingiae]
MKPLLDGFLYESESLFFYGASGSGKSLFAYAFAVAIAGESGEFLSIPCATNKKVLYIDGEMHYNTICDRFESLGESNNLDYLSSTDMVSNKVNPINLNEEVNFEELVDIVIKNQHDLVVIDNVRTLFQLTDEGSSESWQRVNDLIFRLRAAGASVIMIHHTTKEAYKIDGELIWSGSSNAITVVDRTCGIDKIADQSFSLVTGIKEGRSGDGWNMALNDMAFKVTDKGLSTFDYHLDIVEQLNSYHYWLLNQLDMKSRDKLKVFNHRFGLGLGKKLTIEPVWEASKHMWQMVEDDFDLSAFRHLLKTGELPSQNPDNKPLF